ncbi:phenylalanine--tRNA ligase subunit beta [Blattabacterium sp. (Blaberus giganteus)]|uniref:phenylalanine--tRNA ligase subunit beta n=1 Tax=Blattabacterium sp. (Blaberus giganteus) TaxID=1186051 RepID=UPI00025F7054|nr:phenylalanine--tRNA ligase subunit beta [Blattabacterium sp. (Blaberus giganteus)]AFJ91004.1 phenylalanine-tRNA ligase subunit beta [Blattabacterium sp. (Blaberus giganteus)]
MKISLNWLNKYVFPLNMDENEISNILADIGLPVKGINNVNKDFILDVEVTPNRTDAMSHYGIARDLYAVLKFKGHKVHLVKPIINEENNNKSHIQIFVKTQHEKCIIRYSGILIYEIKIEPSPYWLISRLKSIGIKSINNIIDIMHFVMHELGQPIHIFDMDQIKNGKIIIKNAEKNTYFKSSDNIIRQLDEEDLVICDAVKPLSIAGMMNHVKSNIHIGTKNIFIGSACFNPTIIRNIRKKHFLKIETQHLFDKDMDPNQTVYALQRTAFLIRKIIKNKIICSNVVDFYPHPILFSKIKLRYNKIVNIIGKKISIKKIKKILSLLEIIIDSENDKHLFISVPSYRTDVQREIDVIEEILRIYGIRNIPIYHNIKIYTLPKFSYKTEYKIQQTLFEQLICYGFQEIISSTMINEKKYSFLLNSFFKRKEIKVLNPVNKSYKFMRSSLLSSMIDCIEYNYKNNRIENNMKFFELGKIYYEINNKFLEKTYLGIVISQKEKTEYKPFFYLKGIIEQIFQKSGIFNYTQVLSKHPLLENVISILYNHKNLVEIGKFQNNVLKRKILTRNEIFYAEIDWEYLISIIQEKKIIYVPFSKYPTSRRDLSLLVDKTIAFEKINQLIKKKENHIIKKIKIYDLYEGINLPTSKKSYTISFFFESKKETLTDQIINNSMKEIEFFLKKELKAEIRKKLYKMR